MLSRKVFKEETVTQIEPNKTYTTAARVTAYKAKRFLDVRLLRDENGDIVSSVEDRYKLKGISLFLCNMNRSQTWKNSRGAQGWGEGYLVGDGVATPHAYDVADGEVSLEPIAGPVLSVKDFVECDVISRKVDVVEWLGLEDVAQETS
jgi:hypothetical protein